MTLYDDEMEAWDDLADWPTAEKTIESIRAIATDRACRVIDGVMVDMQTANLIVQVYDKCTPENRERLMALSIEKIGEVVWKCVKR